MKAASSAAAAAALAPEPLQPGPVVVPLRPGPVFAGAPSAAGPCACACAAAAGPSLADADQPQTTLMVRNLGRQVTTEVLVEELIFFGMEGRVDFAHVWRDFKTKSCTGVAFVNFFDPADALALQAMWHGREELGGIPCRRDRWWLEQKTLNVCFAHKQGFDSCVLESRHRHTKDVNMMGWVHPCREGRCRELEKNTFETAGGDDSGPPGLSPQVWPPGFWPPPGLAEAARVQRVSGCGLAS